MTSTHQPAPPRVSAASDAPSFKISALGRGLLRLRYSWSVALPAICVNALLQAALVSAPVWALVAVLGSVVSFVLSALLIQAASVRAQAGDVTWEGVWATAKSVGVRYTITIVVVACLVVLGIMTYIWPGLVVAALLAFASIAAITDDGNPFIRNFRIIAAHPFRWLITMLCIAVIAGFAWIAMFVTGFFVPGFVGAFAVCLGGGLLCWWWSEALTLIYFRRRVQQAPVLAPAH